MGYYGLDFSDNFSDPVQRISLKVSLID
jgi:hypothetical protein